MALFLCLVGIVEASLSRYVITGVITMGQIIVLAVYVMFGLQGAQKAADEPGQKPPPFRAVLCGAIAGLMISVVLAIFVLIGQQVNLQDIFIHASPPCTIC